MCNSPRVNSSTTAARKHMKLQYNVQNKMRLTKLHLFTKTTVSFVCNGHPKVGSTVPTVRSTKRRLIRVRLDFFCRRSRGKNNFSRSDSALFLTVIHQLGCCICMASDHSTTQQAHNDDNNQLIPLATTSITRITAIAIT